MCRPHADSGTFLHPPATLVDNHAEIYNKNKKLAEIYCLCFDETLERTHSEYAGFSEGERLAIINGMVPVRS